MTLVSIINIIYMWSGTRGHLPIVTYALLSVGKRKNISAKYSRVFWVSRLQIQHKIRSRGLMRSHKSIWVQCLNWVIDLENLANLWYQHHEIVHKNCRHGYLNKICCLKNRHVHPWKSMTAILWINSWSRYHKILQVVFKRQMNQSLLFKCYIRNPDTHK